MPTETGWATWKCIACCRTALDLFGSERRPVSTGMTAGNSEVTHNQRACLMDRSKLSMKPPTALCSSALGKALHDAKVKDSRRFRFPGHPRSRLGPVLIRTGRAAFTRRPTKAFSSDEQLF